MLTVMREGLDNLSRTLSATSTSTANTIAEAFETFKGELEIANEDESEQESEQESAGTQDHESLGEPLMKTLMMKNRGNPRILQRLSIEHLTPL